MEAAARKVGAIAALLLAACGVKGPPRAPNAEEPPPEMAEPRCTTCVVEEQQPGLVQDEEAPELQPIVPEADASETEPDEPTAGSTPD